MEALVYTFLLVSTLGIISFAIFFRPTKKMKFFLIISISFWDCEKRFLIKISTLNHITKETLIVCQRWTQSNIRRSVESPFKGNENCSSHPSKKERSLKSRRSFRD